ncbi:hypothetical protein C8N43_2473 [Litoreibacter ponti]|uniref:Uncharacterized protein n=1 Tax=Litoreibacter ponti TaxID=1510457 RepID=A0A2T6BP11_9RHOB|nr:hypothetical protein [Litoreibacter ponti]PTX57801.1 hypothetical protein C8N43_2473 [Litoreibacter ponti]
MRFWGGAAVAVLALSGCDIALPGGSVPQSEIIVTADRVTLRGPTGFCVDPDSSRHRPSEAFIVFGNCAAIAGNDELPQPFVRAFATVTVLPSQAGSTALGDSGVALEQFFSSTAGKAALSGNGDPDTVEVLDSFLRNGAFFVHARDRSGGSIPGADNTYWRGYFDVKSSLVAVSVMGLESAPLSSSDGLATLYDFANSILEDQRPNQTAPASSNPDDVQNTGLLRRLFG